MDVIFDLFGDTIPEGWGKAGRPEHSPTDENRNKVNMLLVMGWSNKRISKTLGITAPTLRKHYFSELKFRDDARDKIDARHAMLLWQQCEAGNVAALKEFRKFMDRNDLMKSSALYADDKIKLKASPKLGKKEKATLDAQDAGQNSIWDDDLKITAPPRAN